MIEYIIEAFFLGVALAMDALAASVALSASNRKNFTLSKMLMTAGAFGLFQFFMPLAGFYGSCIGEKLFHNYAKWIAGLLLIALGGKMFFDRDDEEKTTFSVGKLILLALATSIDAFLVGISYRFMNHQSIFLAVTIIGGVTFAISMVGCLAGRLSGRLLGSRCIILGALVLIMLGLKVILFS